MTTILHPEFLQLRLGFQKKARLLRKYFDHDIAPADAIALTLLQSSGSLQAAEISQQLKISRPRVSQLLKRLESEKLIALKKNKNDQRSSFVKISSKGEVTLNSLHQINNCISRSLCSALNEDEIPSFIAFMRRFATDLGAPEIKIRENEFPLIREQNRIASITGTLSNDYMSTGRALSEIHTLLELNKNPNSMLSDLTNQIPLDLSSISRLVTRLEHEKLLIKKLPPNNQKSALISLSESGIKELERVVQLISAQHQNGLSSFSNNEIDTFCSFLHKIDQASAKELLSGPFTIKVCNDTQDFYMARSFLIEELVNRKLHESLSANILPTSNFVTILKPSETIQAICEFEPSNNLLMLRRCFYHDQTLGKKFFIKSLKLAALSYPAFAIEITACACPPMLHELLGLVRGSRIHIDRTSLLLDSRLTF